MTKVALNKVQVEAIRIDLHLINNRYALELKELEGANDYEVRYKKSRLDRKYDVVKEALLGLYDLGIQHNCNLRQLLDNYNEIVAV